MSIKVLTYHNVGKPPKGIRLKTLFVGSSQLRRQLIILKKLGVITLKDLLDNKKPSKGFLITFDDAYEDFWQNALPIFLELNLRCVIFVPAKLVGSYNQWDYEFIRMKKPLMNWQQLRELLDLGFEIGSHSLTHPYLSKIDKEKAWEEIYTSKSMLEDKLGCEVVSFCYPYGDYNPYVRDMVQKAGYKIAFTTKHGDFESSKNMFEVNRITIFGNDFLPKFLYKVLL